MSTQQPPPPPPPYDPQQPQQQPPAQQGWGPPSERKPRKRRRVFMWVILAINLLFLVVVIATLNIESSCGGKVGDDLAACQAGEGIGKGAVFLVLLFVWAIVDVILGVIFLVTRGRAGTAYDR